MTQYQATVQLSGSTLTVSRPHAAPQAVDDLVDSLTWAVREEGTPVSSLAITIVTADDPLPAAEPLPPEQPATQPAADQPQPDSQPTPGQEPLPEPDDGTPYPGRPPAAQPLTG